MTPTAGIWDDTESAARLQLLLEHLPAIFWATDRELRFTASAGAGLSALGLHPHAVEGLTLWEFFGQRDDTYTPIAAHLRALQGETVKFDVTWATREYDCTLTPLRDDRHNITGIIGIALDVTGRRQMEKALRDSQCQYDELVNSVDGIVWEAEATTLRFTFVSKQAERLLGYPTTLWREQADFWQQHLHPEDRAWDLRFCLEASLARGRHEFEHRMIAADGRIVWLRNNVSIVFENGVPAKLRGVMIESTERRRLVDDLRAARRELEGAYSQLAAIIEFTPEVAIHGYDAEGVLTLWNRASEKLYGFSREQVAGRRVAEFLLAEPQAGAFVAMVQQSLKTNVPVPWQEWEMYTASGHTRRVMTSLFPIRFGQNQTQVIGMHIDAEVRPRGAAPSSGGHAHAHPLLQAGNLIPWEAGPEGLHFTHMGPQIVALLGHPLEAWYSEHFWRDQLFAADRDRALAFRRQVQRTGEGGEHKYRLVAADGRLVWLREIIASREKDKPAASLHGFLVDLSSTPSDAAAADSPHPELLRRVAALVTARLSLEEVIPRVLAEISNHLPQLRVLYAILNETGKLQVMYAAQPPDMSPVLGRLTDLGANPQWLATLRRREPLVMAETTPATPNLWDSGTRALLQFPLHHAQGLAGVLGLEAAQPRQWPAGEMELMRQCAELLGVTLEAARVHQERRRLEEERTAALNVVNTEMARAARLKEEFLASMSHELRTPLNAILGMSEAMREQVYGPMHERQAAALRTIEENGRHLLTLINDVLDLSKIEAGKLDLEIGPIAVEPFYHACLRLFEQMAREKGLELTATLDHAVTLIHADERRLRQILVNLVSNAVKFTPPGGTIGFEVIGKFAEEMVCFTVQDTGIGISMQDIVRLFQPFVQLDSSLSRRYSGTGLGLVLVHRLVELHGGSVAVESTPGQGSRFTVSLPWPEAQTQAPALPASATIRRAFILAAVQGHTRQLVELLTELGLITFVHRQAEGALQKVTAVRPEVLFVDQALLGPACREWLAELRADPHTCNLPVLLLADPQETTPPAGAAVTESLTLPVSREQLQWALSRVFVHWSMRPPVMPALPEATSAPSSAPPLILVIEESDSQLHPFFNYLRAWRYRVISARDTSEALARSVTERPDIILMDLHMPGADSLQALRRLRAETRLRAVPIIALTALDMPGDRDRCLAAGADAYLSKPVTLKTLNETIVTYLQARGRTA